MLGGIAGIGWRRLAAAAAALNFPWEVAQMPAYAGFHGLTVEHVIGCFIATLGDVAMTLAIAIIVMRSFTCRNSYATGSHVYLSTALTAMPIALLVERVGLDIGVWSYGPRMPMIFGIGALPLLQLVVLSPLALYIMRRSFR